MAPFQQVGVAKVWLCYNKYRFGEVWLNYSKYRVGEGCCSVTTNTVLGRCGSITASTGWGEGVLLSNNKYIFGEVRLNYSKYRMGEVRLSYKRKNKKNDRNGFQKNILIQSSYSPVLSFCFPSEVDKGNMKVRKK